MKGPAKKKVDKGDVSDTGVLTPEQRAARNQNDEANEMYYALKKMFESGVDDSTRQMFGTLMYENQGETDRDRSQKEITDMLKSIPPERFDRLYYGLVSEGQDKW